MKLDENISAVITGGASGLGEATARELSKFGVKCALFDLNAEKGETVASEIGGVFCEANVTSDESVVAAFERSRSEIGQERILINCAGIGIAVKTAAAVLTAIPIPAQLISILSCPISLLDLSKAATTLSSLVTLASQKTPPISDATVSPFSALRSKSAHLTPNFDNSRAVASPRPDAPPVITALIFSSNFIFFPLV